MVFLGIKVDLADILDSEFMNSPVLAILVKVALFTLMLAIGVNLSWEKLISLWHNPNRLIRSLLAVVVLVPLIVIVLLRLFDLSPESATVLAILAAAPGAPLTTKRAQMAGGNIPYSASLQLTLALLAVITTPLTLAIFYALFDLATERVTVLQVTQQVLQVQFLPICIGLLLQKFRPQWTEKIGKLLILIADFLLVIMVLTLLPEAIPLIFKIKISSMIAIVIMAISSLAIGHFLGGAKVDERSALAVASVARNIGLALFILTFKETAKPFIPTLVAYMILGAMVAVPYSLWSKRQLAQLPQNSAS